LTKEAGDANAGEMYERKDVLLMQRCKGRQDRPGSGGAGHGRLNQEELVVVSGGRLSQDGNSNSAWRHKLQDKVHSSKTAITV